MPHALVVDDDLNNLLALTELVEREGFSTSTASTLKDARAQVEARLPDVVLIDLFLPDGRGIDLLKDLEGKPTTDVVLITGNASVETAIEALRVGVSDYLPKPVDIPRLKTILANVARTRELKEEIDSLREKLRKLGHFGPMIGASSTIQRVYDLIARVAPTDATVLLMGESGTGKEMVAQTLHELSKRRKEPFLPLNCGAISPNLIESELFGHERGSFTGANRMHKGYFERSVGGTLFLDEITEMPIELQVKLLRVLETGAIIRVGGDQQVPVDVRVIAATNRNPEEAVTQGKLREDLLYRLKVFPIHLPPLRERGEDVILLADHFLWQLNKTEGTAKKFARATLDRLKAHAWPGNVRELKNVVHRAFILADEEIGADCLPPEVGGVEGFTGPDLHFKVGVSIEEAERRLILATLEHYTGDKKKTSEVLGVSLKTLYNRLNAYKLI
jgi:two-component system, NtrC family, response regulator AtoC